LYRLLVLDLDGGVDGSTPCGWMNKSFDGDEAVLIHLDDFSLWVTACYDEG
jgi:hypothetical protein